MHSRFREIRTSLTREDDFLLSSAQLVASCVHRGVVLETVLRHPQAVLGRLGTISARLGPSWRHLGPSRRADRRRQNSFGKVRTSLTREHHFVVALTPFSDDLGVILGPSCGHIGHLGVILGVSCAISVLRLRKTDDA